MWLDTKYGIKEDDVIKLTFRDKQYSWHKYFMHITASENAGRKHQEYIAGMDSDPFLRLFTLGVVNQKSCFTCPFRNKTAADVRLGDYWGSRFERNEDGVSMILVNTEVGRKLVDAIKLQVDISAQNIEDRFGQQHTDYQYPKYYEASLMMLRDDHVRLKSIINLYETDFDRLKRKVKVFIKRTLRLR